MSTKTKIMAHDHQKHQNKGRGRKSEVFYFIGINEGAEKRRRKNRCQAKGMSKLNAVFGVEGGENFQPRS